MGSHDQYTGWDEYVVGRGVQYSAWNESNMGRGAPEYIEREDHYPYARKDVVDDTVHEEDFQNVNDDNEQYPQDPSFHINAYNQVEHYSEPPPFHNNEWEGERGHHAWNDHDEVDMVRGSQNGNTDNEYTHDYHSWQGSTSTGSTSHARSSWPYYDNL
jgi:hypothetical protein